MIKIDLIKYMHDRTWFGFDRVEVWITKSTTKNFYYGNWKWRWIRI